MKKVLLSLLSAALLITVAQPAKAEDQKVLAIIDSAVDSTKFNSIIHEVCITSKTSVASNMACPNGKDFMEGIGAAAAPWPKQNNSNNFNVNNATFHGDTMVKVALTTNPNLKIVFVRFNDVTLLGNSYGDADALSIAIEWVSKNAEKYSIDALSVSQSSVSAGNLSRCKNDIKTISSVSFLNSKNIPVFVATGNDRRTDVIGFPSCVSGMIAVGALGNQTQLEKVTNTGPGLAMVALTGVKVPKYDRPIETADSVYGTSVATALASASYVNRNTFKTFGEYLNSLPKILINKTTYIRN